MKSVKTPPSLSWLIKQKSRLLGELEKLESAGPREIAESKRLLKEAQKQLKLMETRYKFSLNLMSDVASQIKSDIKAIETALSMHEVKFNQDLIHPVKLQDKERFLKHGVITRGIYQCLKITNKPTTPTEVTLYILQRLQIEINDENVRELRRSVRKRMGYLGWEGKLRRLHPKRTVLEGRWVLP